MIKHHVAKRFAVAIALGVLVFGQNFAFANSAAPSLENRVKEYKLENGLRILVLRRPGSPTFAGYVRFLVGGSDEITGQSGVAHILEHMLFKGSERIGTSDFAKEKPLMDEVENLGAQYDAERRKGKLADEAKVKELREKLYKAMESERQYIKEDEISEIYQRFGAMGFNAFTAKDTTTYVIKLPANKFELWAWLESDRLRTPILREYYSERDVIMEERRRSVDSSPEGTLYERMLATAFIAHPYGIPVIGWPSDITLMPLDYVKSFLKTYYSPNNMVVCIVGDLEPEYVYQTIKNYFGDIPPQVIPPRVATVEPAQMGERRVEVEFDANSQLMMAFHKPTHPDRDVLVMDVIHSVLAEGRTSRLYKSLVLEKGLAVEIGGFEAPGERYDNLYILQATPRQPHSAKEVEDVINEEIEKLKSAPISKTELQKVVNGMEMDYLNKLQSNSGLAHYLSEYEIVYGDWRTMTRYMPEVRKITPDDVLRVARKYLVKSNRTVATLVPHKADAGTEGAK
jgi:predicted Zn-dependent peptidase